MDLLVPLYRLPEYQAPEGVVIRRANAHELGAVNTFVEKNFGEGWADENVPGFSRQPISVFVALRGGKLIGFAAYEVTRRDFFGPTGVAQSERGKGIGRALLLACLYAMRELGYAYAIIGGAGPVTYYQKTVGAIPIAGSDPGVYADPIRS